MTKVAFWLPPLMGLALGACTAPAPIAPPADPPPVAAPPVAAPPVAVAADFDAETATLAQLLHGIEEAYAKGNYDRGLALVKRVYEFKGDSIASNLLDERESDIAPGSTVPKEEVKGTVERRSVEVRRYMEDYILILAAALVLGELLFLRRRGEL